MTRRLAVAAALVIAAVIAAATLRLHPPEPPAASATPRRPGDQSTPHRSKCTCTLFSRAMRPWFQRQDGDVNS